jgi:predicted enzyme related to lactoylglutathione lyase
MPVKQYTPGTPTWADLLSRDMDAATGFYTGLFGWEPNDTPMPDGSGVYRMFRLRGHDIAGLGQQSPEMAEEGMPSAWTLYIGGSVDDAAKRAQDAGGQIAMPPADIADSGRLCVLLDPGGAAIGVWEAAEHKGFTLAGEPGTFAWAEVNTRDYDRCRRFYPAVFGWDVADVDMPTTRYTVWKHEDDEIAGMLEMTEQWEGIPSTWMLYFAVADADAASRRASELGGAVMVQPFDSPYGRVTVLSDPAGAPFSAIQLRQ